MLNLSTHSTTKHRFMRSYLFTGMVLLLVCFISEHATAQYSFTGIFQKQEKTHQFIKTRNWEAFQVANQQKANQGFHLVNIETAGQGGQLTFCSVYEKGGQQSLVKQVSDWKTLLATNQELKGSNMYLTDIEVSEDRQGRMQFVGLWKKHDKKIQVWKLNSWKSVLALNNTMKKQNMFIQDIEVHKEITGKLNFMLIFKQGHEAERSHLVAHTNPKAFATDRIQRNKSGYNVNNYLTFTDEGKQYQVAIFKRGKAVEEIHQNINLVDLDKVLDDMQKKGLSLMHLQINGANFMQKKTTDQASNYLPDSRAF